MASNKRLLKAYARFDGSGRIVPSSVILRKNKPKNGKWKEVQTYQCCNFEPVPFISVWRTTAPNESITLPYSPNGEYRGVIDWGDGTTSPNSYENRTHIYTTAGDHTITITGATIGFSFGSYGGTPTKIRSISQWGNIQLSGVNVFTNQFFQGCSSLNLATVIDVPNLSNVTSFANMFTNCSSLTTVNRMNEWDVSGVTDMGSMFNAATSFNQDIGSWNVSNVTNMRNMFDTAYVFNQNIGNWNVSKVTNMSRMFFVAQAFNQNIGSWNVSNVTDMGDMFSQADLFNNGGSPSINNWNVSNVTDMTNMFAGSLFNQPIGSWNVSNVTDMSYMFAPASAFNQNIGSWDVSSVTTMRIMFSGASAFNNGGSGTIGTWDVANVTDMLNMFNDATVFNQNLSTWCVTLIPSLPSGFATGAIAWVLPKPVWGTCP